MGRGSWRLEQSGSVQNFGHVASVYSSPRDMYVDASVDSAGGSNLEKTKIISHTEGQMWLKGCHVSLVVVSTWEKKQNETVRFCGLLHGSTKEEAGIVGFVLFFMKQSLKSQSMCVTVTAVKGKWAMASSKMAKYTVAHEFA